MFGFVIYVNLMEEDPDVTTVEDNKTDDDGWWQLVTNWFEVHKMIFNFLLLLVLTMEFIWSLKLIWSTTNDLCEAWRRQPSLFKFKQTPDNINNNKCDIAVIV